MNAGKIVRLAGGVFSMLLVSGFAAGQNIPAEYQAVLKELGRKGDYADGVLKVGIPRNDLHVSVAGIALPTSFGFGGWVAFARGEHDMDVVMGDLVLLQREVNPVMSALLDHGLEVTALHNHFFWEEPRIFYMHVHGHGAPQELARRLMPALDLVGHVPQDEDAGWSEPTSREAPVGLPGTPDVNRLNAIIGHDGTLDGGVYKVVVGRPDIDLEEMGAKINSRMGLNSWAAVVGGESRAVIAGDIAMSEVEVNPVLKALRTNGLDVVALHHHMIGGRPIVIFHHYWGIGPEEKLASGFRAALAELGKK